MNRLVTLAVPVLLTLTGLATLTPSHAVTSGPDQLDRKRPTEFALYSRGYGSRARGGEIPADSSTTAFSIIGCTNYAGVEKGNQEVEVTVPGVGVLSGVTTTLRTTKKDGVVGSTATESIASLELIDSPFGTLSINTINSRARVFHDDQGFHATTETEVGSMTFTPPIGEPQDVPLPTPGDPALIPGLAEISLGFSKTEEGAGGANARALALEVEVLPSNSRIKLGLAHTKIYRGVKSGVFRGYSAGLRADAVDGNVTKGRTPLSLMPCQGTDGELREKSLAGLNLGGQVEVSGINSKQRASQTDDAARGMERGSVSEISLGGGQLVINGIVGRVKVRRVDGKTITSTDGTTVGSVIYDGETQTFPDTDVLEFPGVARLERSIVDQRRNVVEVIALRITLLDDAGGVIDLGMAKVGLQPSGL